MLPVITKFFIKYTNHYFLLHPQIKNARIFNTSFVKLDDHRILYCTRREVTSETTDSNIIPGNFTGCENVAADTRSDNFWWGWVASFNYNLNRNIHRTGFSGNTIFYIITDHRTIHQLESNFAQFDIGSDVRLTSFNDKIYIYGRTLEYLIEITIDDDTVKVNNLYLGLKLTQATNCPVFNLIEHDEVTVIVDYLDWYTNDGVVGYRCTLKKLDIFHEIVNTSLKYNNRTGQLSADNKIPIVDIDKELAKFDLNNEETINNLRTITSMIDYLYGKRATEIVNQLVNAKTPIDKLLEVLHLRQIFIGIPFLLELSDKISFLVKKEHKIFIRTGPYKLLGKGTDILPQFSFSTPLISITKGNQTYLLGVGHTKILSGDKFPLTNPGHDYLAQSKIAKFRQNVYQFYRSEFKDKYKPNFGTMPDANKSECTGYIYLMYFFLIGCHPGADTFQSYHISDSYLPLLIRRKSITDATYAKDYYFSLIFPTGLIYDKSTDLDIYVSAGDGDFYSCVMAFSLEQIIENCRHDVTNFVPEDYRYKLLIKCDNHDANVIDTDDFDVARKVFNECKYTDLGNRFPTNFMDYQSGGGTRGGAIDYHAKYLKYKAKYLSLK